MHIRKLLVALLLFIFFVPHGITHAQNNDQPQDAYYRGRVNKILDEGALENNGMQLPFQLIEATVIDGNLKNRTITINHGAVFSIDKSKFVKPGDTVVILYTTGADGTPTFQIIDRYRLDILYPFLFIFAFAVILLSRWRGVGSIVGMGVSLVVITLFIVPRILAGQDPLMVSITGCLIIMSITLYLAHGFSRQTTVALMATFLTLLITGIISVLFVNAMHLTGLGSEDAYSLKLGSLAIINFRGLLLGGMLIGALGVLDDVTTGLTASIYELHRANAKLTAWELMGAGLRVGREHVASLVNTLVLAYAGASLPIFIILVTNPNHYPLWSIINSEMIMEEIVRTLSGSFGLITAVPLTTFLAAWSLTTGPKKSKA